MSRWIGRARRAAVAQRHLAADRRDAPRIIAAVASARPEAAGWVVRSGRSAEPTILLVGPPGAGPEALIRVAHQPRTADGLRAATAALTTLRRHLAGDPAAELLPEPIGTGRIGGRSWAMEGVLPGRPAQDMLETPDDRFRMLSAISTAIGRVHAVTSQTVIVDDRLSRCWVRDRVAAVADILDRLPGRSSSPGRLAGLESALTAELSGRQLAIGWIHGDLWPANVLVQGTEPVVSGIIDWDSAAADELAVHDLLHLAITTRRLIERTDQGAVLADLLSGGTWTRDDEVVLGPPGALDSAERGVDAMDDRRFGGIPARTAVWLYWLRFVGSNLARHQDLATDRAWVAANVTAVAACA